MKKGPDSVSWWPFQISLDKCVLCYYAFSLAVFQLLFSTANIGPNLHVHGHGELYEELTHTFVAAFGVSSPMLYEFALDQFLAWYNPKYRQTLSNNRLADVIVISSIFVPGLAYLIVGQLSLYFAHLIVSLGSCLLMCGLYGRLLSLFNVKWGFTRCAVLLGIFAASQIMSVHFVRISGGKYTFQHTNLSIALALKAACLILHMYSSRHMFLRSSSVEAAPGKADDQVVAKYSQMITAAIIAVYLAAQLVILSTFATHGSFGSCLVQFDLCLLIAIAVVAGAKPGRIVRFSMMTLQNEIEYKETFVRYISHEIRSPLSTTTLGLDFLLQQMANHTIAYDEVFEVVKDAKISADLATSTMNDLLMFDKINSFSFEIFTTITTAWPFIVNCVKPFKTQARVSKLNLTCTIDAPEHKTVNVLIDQPKIEQVVRNFITNAIKFTQAGGTLAMHVSVLPHFTNNTGGLPEGDLGVLRFSLKDTGAGISHENLPRLFGQYVQFDANKLQHGSGSGLGLWLSKAIVELHGGYIGACSEGEGLGCEFYFEIPCFRMLDPSDGSDKNRSICRSLYFSDSDRPVGQPSTPSFNRKQAKPVSPKTLPMTTRQANSPKSITQTQVLIPKTSNPSSPQRSIGKNGATITVGATAGAAGSSKTMHTFPGASLPTQVQERLQDLANRIVAAAGANRSRSNTFGGEQEASLTASGKLAVPTDKDSSTRMSEMTTLNARHVPRMSTRLSAAEAISARTADTTKDALDESLESAHVPPYKVENPDKVVGVLKVLLADDSPLSRKMLARTLTGFCSVIDHASNGLDALNAVTDAMDTDAPFDVVIIDNYMPVMNGPDAIRSMRVRGYRGIILAVTGATGNAENEQLVRAGADAVILKPLNLQTFKTTMNELMERSRVDMPVEF